MMGLAAKYSKNFHIIPEIEFDKKGRTGERNDKKIKHLQEE